MTTADFQKQPRDDYAFDYWVWDKRVETPLGSFTVEFQMLGDSDTNPPDEEMLKRAAELVRYAEDHGHYILDIVFGYYLFAVEKPNWLEKFEIPKDLSRDKISAYLRGDSTLVVSRHLNWDEPYDSAIYIVPLWDEEHALTLAFRDGGIAAVNDSAFKFESGVLRCG
ncbi:MAG TPA: hypothetical protein VGM58_08120 [Verrucomicrobiae bacterium]|jgi:hypothetical protein